MTIARVIDYETTGTPEEESAEVIEMGSTEVDIENRAVVDFSFQSLIRPRLPIPPVAMAVHHIQDRDVRHAPDARDLWDTFLGYGGNWKAWAE